MSRIEFDDQLRRKLENEDYPVAPDLWNKIQSQLPVVEGMKPTKVVTFYKSKKIAAAAAIIILFSSVGALFLLNQNKINIEPVLTQSKTEEKQQITEENTSGAEEEVQQSPQTPIINNSNTQYANQNNSYRLPVNGISDVKYDEDFTSVVKDDNEIEVIRKIEEGQNGSNEIIHSGKSILEQDYFKKPSTMKEQDDLYVHYAYENTNVGKGKISVGGGMNYGNMNEGYNIGVSGKQSIGNKFYVDGSVGIVINQSSDKTLNFSGNFMNDVIKLKNDNSIQARPGEMAAVSKYQPNDGLYYIQVNPSLGYQLTSGVAVAAGVDMQQLLNNNYNNDVVFFNNAMDAKLVKSLDFGVTVKAEVNVSKSVVAGLMFREGINNVFSKNSPFANRRYVQLNMKYNLPL